MSPATWSEPDRLVGGDQKSEPLANTSGRVAWNRSYAVDCSSKGAAGGRSRGGGRVAKPVAQRSRHLLRLAEERRKRLGPCPCDRIGRAGHVQGHLARERVD